MEIIAIIPARGGSKGILKKNLRILGSKALIEHTINSAKQSKKFERIIVSTDDRRIAVISKLAGAEVPFERPKRISKDDTTMIEVIEHALTHLKEKENYQPDIVVLLQPTSPFRSNNMIKNSIELLKKSKATSVLSVAETKQHPYSSFLLTKKFLKPLKSDYQNYSIRQKRATVYHPTGSLYTFWANNVRKYNSIYGPKILPIIIKDKSLNIDIDDWSDLFLAEVTEKFWRKYTRPKSK